MSKIICYDYYGNAVTSLTQWDTNRILKIRNWQYDVAPVIQWTNRSETESYQVESTLNQDGTVTFEVPNAILQNPETAIAFIGVSRNGENGSLDIEIETVFKVEFPVQRRAKPSGYIFSDNASIVDIAALVEYFHKVIDYNNLTNQPVKNLALSMTEDIMLTDIADGCYVVTEQGIIKTAGKNRIGIRTGTELLVTTNNGLKSAINYTGGTIRLFNDNMTVNDEVLYWLNTSDKDLQITESATDDTIPTSKAVKDYVDNNIITNYNDLLNQPIKNLDLSPYGDTNPIQLSAIGEGVYIVTSNGYIITKGGYKKLFGKGTELVIVLTNKSGVPTLCMSVQDGSNFYRVDDDITSSSEIRSWLSSYHKTSVIDEANISKIPTAEAVMNYVTEIVNNSIADVSTLIGTVEEVAE